MSRPITPIDIDYIRLRCVDVGECWIWKGACTKGGYPIAGSGATKIVYPYVLAWKFRTNLEVPAGMVVRRTCDERLCCNPEHTTLTTRGVVARLAAARGAYHQPERIVRITLARRRTAKLSMAKAREIRASTQSAGEIAAAYGINKTMVYRIRRNEAWREGAANSSIFNMAQRA